MKIAIIDPVGSRAGMNYYNESLLKSFSRMPIETVLFTDCEQAVENIKVFPFFNLRSDNALFKFILIFLGYVKSFFICRRHKVKNVIFHLFSASFFHLLILLIAKLFCLNTIIVAHDIDSFGKKFINKDVRIIKTIIYNNLCCHIIVHNKFSYNEIRRYVHDYNFKKVKTIRQGGYFDYIDNAITKEIALNKLGLQKKEAYLLFFGQIKEVKGLDILLHAMKYINRNVKLIIAGKPWENDFSHYQSIIDKYHLQSRVISFIRFISNDERDMLFKASDAIVLPYRVIYQSAVLLMSMSYGLPVIASDLEANKEIIQHSINGLLFKSGDHKALAREVKSLLENPKLISSIRNNSKKTIEKDFSWDSIADEYVKQGIIESS